MIRTLRSQAGTDYTGERSKHKFVLEDDFDDLL